MVNEPSDVESGPDSNGVSLDVRTLQQKRVYDDYYRIAVSSTGR